jgi:ABC-type glycerol-3-phosphate transport system substrate-binding protein
MNVLGLVNLGFSPMVDFVARDDSDGRGPYIEEWLSALPQPSDAEQDAASQFVDLPAYAANARWLKETGGITVGGAAISTDRESQSMINGARSLVQEKPDAVIMFKAAGGFVSLDAPSVTAIALAVGEHVQACFAKEAEVVAAITAGTITTPQQIDEAFSGV